jgi:segregation and condensation protein B
MSERDTIDRSMARSILEAILFAHEGPVTVPMLGDAIPELERDVVVELMDELKRAYDSEARAFEIVRIAGGYQVCTRPEWSTWVARFQRGKRRVRLSRAAVETLGIIAYRQPVTRAEIEDVRGVDAGGVLHTLLERDLITVKGRAKTVGRPLLYATTGDFLEYFGLDSVQDLPKLEEIEELLRDRAEIVEEIEGLEGEGEAPADEGAVSGEEPAVPEDEGEEGAATLAGSEEPDPVRPV